MAQKLTIDPVVSDFLNIFKESFQKIFRHIDRSHKQRLLAFSPVLFKKWYYTALFDETILSPANTIDSLYQEQTIAGISLHVPENSKNLNAAVFSLQLYTEKSHPILTDLQGLIDACSPAIDLDVSDQISDKSIIESLSLADPFYLEFLTILAFRLKLITKLPALYTSKAQATPNAQDFFQQTNKICLQTIIDASAAICADQLKTEFHSLQIEVTKEMILTFLTELERTDDVFQAIYQKVGIDSEKIWKLSQLDSLTETDSFLLSTTFYLGILLDKWFISPFGSYLRLIQPLYFNTFDFIGELNSLCSNLSTGYDPMIDLFSPCTYYSLTPLGHSLLCPDKPFSTLQQMPHVPDIPQLSAAIRSKMRTEAASDENEYPLSKEEKIITFKIKYQKDKRYWKMLEVQDCYTLDTLSMEINMAFSFEDSFNYSFFIEQAGVFVSDHSKGFQKASEMSLDNLELAEGQTMIYETAYNPTLKLELEISKIAPKKPGILYPRILKQSKWITLEESENI